MAIRPNSYFTQKRMVKSLFPLFLAVVVFYIVWFNPIVILNPMKGVKSFDMEVSSIFMGCNIVMYWLIAVVLLIALLIAVSICYKVAKPLRSYLL
jgi:hypothetical protein